MKRVFVIIAFFGFIGNAFAQYDEKARTILDAMSSKYQSYSSYTATFVMSHINKMAGINEKLEGKITIMGDMYHLVLPDQEIYNDGKDQWIYFLEGDEVNITESDEEDNDLNPSKIITAYKDGYKYALVAGSSNANQNVIELAPEEDNDDLSKIRMTLGKDNTIKNWIIFDKKGNEYKYDLMKFTPNTAKDASSFRWNAANYPGKNIHVEDLR